MLIICTRVLLSMLVLSQIPKLRIYEMRSHLPVFARGEAEPIHDEIRNFES